MKKLIIVDISSFIFRAFYAIRILNAPDGTPVNAVSGVLSMLLKLLNEYQPSYIVLARDCHGGSFRNQMYKEYKANRAAPPDELIPQFDLIDQLIHKLKLPDIKIKNYEADDIIGSLATQWHDEFDEILIASGDKDLMQFVDEKVHMVDTMKNVTYGPQEVFDKMGVWPNQIVDYLSMLGDTADNVPGMKGIGAKGAAKLLAEYQTLENIVENKDKLSGKKLTEAFTTYLEDGYLSKKLIKIPTDVDLGKTIEDVKFAFAPDKELYDFLDSLGFKSFIARLKNIEAIEQAVSEEEAREEAFAPTLDVEPVFIADDNFQILLNKINRVDEAYFHFLFSNNSIVDKELVALSVAFDFDDDEFLYVLPFGMTPFTGIQNVSIANLEKLLKVTLGRKGFKFVTYDAKGIFHLWPFTDDLDVDPIYDVMQMDFVNNPDGAHELCKVTSKIAFSDGTVQDLNSWSALNALHIKNHYRRLIKQLTANDLLNVYLEIDAPLIPVLARMEKAGIMLNPPYLQKLQIELAQQITELEEIVAKYTENPVNLRSPKQVGVLLFEELKLPVIKKTKTGYSTGIEILEELQSMTHHPVVDALIKYRELDKLNSTYVTSLPKLVSPITGRVHTCFNMHTASTGRLSSTNPNLQNIPVRTENGKKIRKAFIASKRQVLLSADYSQVELRILAHMSKDPTLMNAFKNGVDVHAQTAAEIMDITVSNVSDVDRRQAKAVNFGLMYGQSSFGLAKTLGISRTEAFNYIEKYFHKFGAVKGFLDSLKEQCEATGYSITLFNRKRFLPDIHNTNRNIKSFAEREAINTPVQGTASDIIKKVMVAIDKEMRERKMKSKMLLQVHDELIFDVCEDELLDMKELVRRHMENDIKLDVPLTVEMGIGVNWFDLK